MRVGVSCFNMAKGSFILHLDSLNFLDKLTKQQAGEFIVALRDYKLTGKEPDEFWLQMALAPFINQFARDDEKYQEFAEKQREKGLKSAESRRKKKQPKSTAVNHGQPRSTESTYNDNVSVSVSESDNVNDKPLVLPHLSDRFKKGWEILIKEPKWKKKSQNALRLSLVTLGKFSEDEAIEMMKNCIEGGWQKLYPIKKTNDLFGNTTQENIYKPSERYPKAE